MNDRDERGIDVESGFIIDYGIPTEFLRKKGSIIRRQDCMGG
jgi:hypothetical protein